MLQYMVHEEMTVNCGLPSHHRVVVRQSMAERSMAIGCLVKNKTPEMFNEQARIHGPKLGSQIMVGGDPQSLSDSLCYRDDSSIMRVIALYPMSDNTACQCGCTAQGLAAEWVVICEPVDRKFHKMDSPWDAAQGLKAWLSTKES